MKLSALLQELGKVSPVPDREIGKITSDSRQADDKSIFVCIKGTKSDGHLFADKAVKAGCPVILVQDDLGLPNQVQVENTRLAYAILCGAICGHPAKKLKLIGVTGTNGKTTITNVIKHVLEDAGKKVGLIGTIQNEIDDIDLPAKHTTPDPAELHVLFERMAKAGCEYVVMECSSHALDQYRLGGLTFEAAVFTNLTQDHLDYHLTMENYFLAKKKLFDMAKVAVINIDDAYGRRLKEELSIPIYTFSTLSDTADFAAKNEHSKVNGVSFELLHDSDIARVHFCMPGNFSASNALAAAGCCYAVGIPFDAVVKGLCSCKGVKGRTQVIETGTDYTVIRDYAHTPDGLEKLLSAVREFATGRVVTLFGCAGERDRTKRPKMTKAVIEQSDFMVLTSDNPRSEDPIQIINDALVGFERTKLPHIVIPNRLEAIHWVLDHAEPGDVILLAGKGHEDYQVLDGCTIYFDEEVIVKEYLAKKAEG